MHGAGQRAAAPACPPIAGPTSHVNGPALALGICFVPSAIVWFIFAYGAMTLNWLLPLNSFHLALPTLSTKPFKEMQLGKEKKKKKNRRRRKTPSQQNVLLSPGSSAWVRFSQHSPATETQSLFQHRSRRRCRRQGYPMAGHKAPPNRPHPQGSSRLARGRVPSQSHRMAAKMCFYPAFIPRPLSPFQHLLLCSAASCAELTSGVAWPTSLLLRGEKPVKAPCHLIRSLIYIYRIVPIKWQLHTCAGGRIALHLPS